MVEAPRRNGLGFAVSGIVFTHLGSFVLAFIYGSLFGVGQPSFSAQGGSTPVVSGLPGGLSAMANLFIMHAFSFGISFIILSVVGARIGLSWRPRDVSKSNSGG